MVFVGVDGSHLEPILGRVPRVILTLCLEIDGDPLHFFVDKVLSHRRFHCRQWQLVAARQFPGRNSTFGGRLRRRFTRRLKRFLIIKGMEFLIACHFAADWYTTFRLADPSSLAQY